MVAVMDISLRHEHRPPEEPPSNLRDRLQWEQHLIPVWDADAEDGWTATAVVRPGPEGQPVITEFRLWHEDPGGDGLTASRLRSFRFGEFSQALHRQYRTAPDPNNVVDVGGQQVLVDPDNWIDMVIDSGFTDLDTLADTPPPRRGRPPLPATELLRVAVLYVKALDDGADDPVKVVADQLGEPAEFIRGRIHMAREPGRDLLTRPPRPGVPGGELTPRALELLQQLEQQKNADKEGDSE